MEMLYFLDTDTLSIQFPSVRAEGQDAEDPDVTLFFDDTNRISEILIEHASRRIDLESLRAEPQFEEIAPETQA